MDRSQTVCFSGHRPEKLAIPYLENSDRVRQIKTLLAVRIEAAVREGYTNFLTGMAKGVDLFAAELVLGFRRNNPSLRLIAVEPYHGHGMTWSAEWRNRHQVIQEQCDEVITLSASYNKSCFNDRNVYLVDHASRLIAVCNGSPSGTRNTIRYATLQGVDVELIDISHEIPLLIWR